VELAVLQVLGDPALVANRLAEALDFHRSVTDKAAAHLALLADNTFRTPWMAAKLLSTDKQFAQTAALSLAKHLAATRPGNRTLFEQHVFETPELWENLVAFSQASPPVLLWHGHGKYAALFKFLAPRFLLAPDHVLDAERVHARWQWACTMKRALKMHSLNAYLRLTHYLESNQTFPGSDELFPHLQAEREQHRVSLVAIEAAGEVALGWRLCFFVFGRCFVLCFFPCACFVCCLVWRVDVFPSLFDVSHLCCCVFRSVFGKCIYICMHTSMCVYVCMYVWL
jgi:hypothetical protein